MIKFRQFVDADKHIFSLKEQDAMPVAGSNSKPPVNPDRRDSGNAHHFDMLQQQLGIGDKEMVAALEGDSIQLWKMPDHSQQWGFLVSPPVNASVKKRAEGSYDVTFLLTQKQTMNPKSFVLPYKQGQNPVYYQGPIENKTVIMTEKELADLIVPPLEQIGKNPMGPGMGMGM